MEVLRHRPRAMRLARRAFGVTASLALLGAGAAAPSDPGTRPAAAPAADSSSLRLDAGSGQCEFGGKNIKSTPWSLQRVLLDELWSEATGEGVTVAVVDTGVDKDNPQLRKALTGGGADFVGDTDGTQDINGHGTRVAGIIAAREADGTGFSGIAPDAAILPLRYTGGDDPEEKGDSSTMSLAIKEAVRQGADIINISSDTANKKPNTGLEAAVETAVANGVLVVVAAGNDGADGKREKTYPAAYDNVLAVAASDRDNERAVFSQSGDFVDIAAPGVGMVSTVPEGGQCAADGTSFAAPYVSGVAALMMEKYPDWTASEVAARLMQTADRPGAGPDARIGWGVVNPLAAVTGSETPQEKPVRDKQQEAGHVTAMGLTVGESDEERTQRLAVYVVATGTVLTLIIAGSAIATRDHRRKRTVNSAPPEAADTTTSTRQ
ncbi:type VII secretion-associated serine protease mycosin [Streptomyces sp. TR02-1]|uniref:type VII secretion-associated serine protease mycosin n=1 Tax=Streptomyces sp. TR02-1 TaxID=3385977 RepID=UPI0039A2A620